MGQDTNIVLEGHRKGQAVCFDTEQGVAWIGEKIHEKYYNFFYKDVVSSVKKLDEKESSLRDSVHIWLGSVAAAGMSSVQDYIISVEWKTGEESLIKVRDSVYEVILRNMTKNQPIIDYEPRYLQAIKDYECNDYTRIKSAMRVFNSISFYKEAKAYADKCQAKLNSSELSSQKEKIEKEAAKKAQNQRKGLFIATICGDILFLLFMLVPGFPIALAIIGLVCCIPLSIITGRTAFENSSSKNSVEVFNSNLENEDDVFEYKNLSNNTFAIKVKEDDTSLITAVLIPEKVSERQISTIAENCFLGCDKIENIIIPQNITRIEKYAFSGCTMLTEIYYKGTKSNWYSISKDVLWDANMPNYTVFCTDGSIIK